MRHAPIRTALLCLALAGCGGGGEAGGPGILKSVAASVRGHDHTCARPAPSGSDAQVACHDAAKAACPEGSAPNRIDFSEEDGEFLVKGYSCV